jgi:hypothetical protein
MCQDPPTLCHGSRYPGEGNGYWDMWKMRWILKLPDIFDPPIPQKSIFSEKTSKTLNF